MVLSTGDVIICSCSRCRRPHVPDCEVIKCCPAVADSDRGLEGEDRRPLDAENPQGGSSLQQRQPPASTAGCIVVCGPRICARAASNHSHHP